MEHIKSIESYNSFVSQAEMVMVKIGTPDCDPCSMTRNSMLSIESEFQPWEFAEVDINDCDDSILENLHIENNPTTLFYIKGRVVERINGMIPYEVLRSKLFILPFE